MHWHPALSLIVTVSACFAMDAAAIGTASGTEMAPPSSLSSLSARPARFLNQESGRPAPCGWKGIIDVAHPGWPKRLVRTADLQGCESLTSRVPAVRAAHVLTMLYRTDDAVATILVTALEDGSAGDVIRCRVSIDGAVLLGRITDAETVELLTGRRKIEW